MEWTCAYLPTAISVDAFFSVHHIDLTQLYARGELHDFYELVYVESGYYYVLLDGERYTVPPGSVIFFAPNTFHSGDGMTRVTATVDILSFSSASPLMRSFDNRCIALTEAQKDTYLGIFALAQSLLCKQAIGVGAREGVSAVELQALKNRFELLLLELCDQRDAPPSVPNKKQYRKEQFRTLSDFMKQNLSRRLSLESIAAECSMSVTATKELCRSFLGCGPIEYLISLRILAAKELIREGSLTFTEIAERTGFGTVHYFSRVFKARTGITPSEYAEMP